MNDVDTAAEIFFQNRKQFNLMDVFEGGYRAGAESQAEKVGKIERVCRAMKDQMNMPEGCTSPLYEALAALEVKAP